MPAIPPPDDELADVPVPVAFMLLPLLLLLVAPVVLPDLVDPVLVLPVFPEEFVVPGPYASVVPVPVLPGMVLLVPVRFVASAACTAAKILATEKAAAAVVIIALDTFMMIS